MVAYTAKNINQAFALADGDTLYIDLNYPVRIVVGAVSTDVTVAIDIMGAGNFRDMDPVITSTTTQISADIWPPKTNYKFTGGASEVRVYGV